MALTLNQFVGFETGGLEEASSTTGSPDATEATIVRSGDRALRMPASASLYDIGIFDDVTSAGNDHIFGFGIYFENDLSPTGQFTFARPSEGGVANSSLSLAISTSNHISVLDAGGSTVTNGSLGTSLFTVDTWHYVEVYYQAQASGAWEVFVDGVSAGSGSGEDFTDGGTLDTFTFIGTTSIGPIIFDDFYWLSGATAATDRLGGSSISEMPQVFGYQGNHSTPNTDFDSSGVAPGTQTTGNWSASGERPWNDSNLNWYRASTAQNGCNAFDASIVSGDSPGPSSGSDDVSGTIKAAKFIWRMDRSGGGATSHQGVYGKWDGSGNADVALTADLDPGTSPANYFHVQESGITVPSSVDDFVMGIDKGSGGQDFDCYEMQAFLLHVPAAAGGVTVTPTAASAISGKAEPTVLLGSLSLSPTTGSSVSNKVDPVAVLGSLSITPAPASSVSARVNPTVTINNPSVSITPSPASSVAGNNGPTVILGSQSITPTAVSAVSERVDPAVVFGSLAITPTNASAIAGKVDPAVTINNPSVTITPTPASAVIARANPATQLGSIAHSPTNASAIAGRINPSVIEGGGLIVTPASASAISGNNGPTVMQSSMTVPPAPATVVASTINPTVVHGPIILVPGQASAVAGKLDPVVMLGAISIIVSPVIVVGGKVDPAVIQGSHAFSPGSAFAIGSTFDPTILTASADVPGGATLSDSGDSLALSNSGPDVTLTCSGATATLESLP